MKRKGGKSSTDLLVCFPTRSHLTLMPKPISCSPARPSSSSSSSTYSVHRKASRRSPSSIAQQHQCRRDYYRSKTLIRKDYSSGGYGSKSRSSILWKQMGGGSKDHSSEPTSPKVTCAGQIKVRPRAGPCKNWQSVMEEIERLHNRQKQKKQQRGSSTWVEALGFKKEIMQFLTCLRHISFDFRCFGSFDTHTTDSSNEDDDNEDEDDDEFPTGNPSTSHELPTTTTMNYRDQDDGSVFSKWFMVLQENQTNKKESEILALNNNIDNINELEPCAPPANALLLMRCRSAPAKSWLEEREEDNVGNIDEEHEDEEKHVRQGEPKDGIVQVDEIKLRKKRESLMELMRHETADFYKFSSDSDASFIAKETWVVGRSGMINDPLSRSRSWKR